MMNRKSTKPKVRCAIYTRKSTEKGLDQEFNSLDAQRESAEAFRIPRISKLMALAIRMDEMIRSGEVNAQSTRLTSLTTTLATEYAKQGRDWEAELRQRAREVALMRELGLETGTAEPAGDETPEREEDEEHASSEAAD
jgi:hypothetical protein